MCLCKKTGFHSVNHKGTMPRFVRVKTCFFREFTVLCIPYVSKNGLSATENYPKKTGYLKNRTRFKKSHVTCALWDR